MLFSIFITLPTTSPAISTVDMRFPFMSFFAKPPDLLI